MATKRHKSQWIMGITPEQARVWRHALFEAWDSASLRRPSQNAGFADPHIQDLYDFLSEAASLVKEEES